MYAEPSGTTIASANCGAWSQTFTYDAFGNIKVFGSDDSEPLYTTNPQTNQIAEQGGTNPTYDADGNETKDYQGNLYAWNTYGRPTAIEGINITYDAMDRPVEQNRSGGYTPLQYSPSGFLMQLNAPSGQSSFVPVPAGGMAIWANNTIYYRHPEWLGSSRLTSDQNHNIYSDSAYSPFGEVYAQAGLSDESFTGMDQSTVTNMYDFPARELAIVQSNWLSPDPAGLASVDPSDPQTWNRYAYVRNSPLTETDPTGMGGFVNGQPTCIWNSCQTRQIEDQAELNYQNEESIYGYGGYNEFDTLSFALAPTCQNDCRVFYGNLDALGLVGLPGMSGLENPQNLLPPGPSPCPAVPFKITGIAPGQAPGTTAISQTPRADIPDGGVAIKPSNFGVAGVNGSNRDVFLDMSFTVDWGTAIPPGIPSGIPTQGPFSPVDVIGPKSVRNSPGNAFDVYNYPSFAQAETSTRTAMVTTYIPFNAGGVKCPH